MGGFPLLLCCSPGWSILFHLGCPLSQHCPQQPGSSSSFFRDVQRTRKAIKAVARRELVAGAHAWECWVDGPSLFSATLSARPFTSCWAGLGAPRHKFVLLLGLGSLQSSSSTSGGRFLCSLSFKLISLSRPSPFYCSPKHKELWRADPEKRAQLIQGYPGLTPWGATVIS